MLHREPNARGTDDDPLKERTVRKAVREQELSAAEAVVYDSKRLALVVSC